MSTPILNAPTPDQRKLALLREHFPQAVETDAQGRIRINASALQLALDPSNPAGIQVEEDGYELRWVGKREAYHSAFLPVQKIIAPLQDDSKHWDTTGNLLIKGDNLDALRLLRQSYFGKVKLIYIDPPYNTQSDAFIYRDDFSAKQSEVLAQLGYTADNIDYIKNIYGARTHSGWLSFMYPRLLLAKDLLRDDGVIFISIDDNEQAQLKLLCDEVFGQENFVSNLTWEKGRKNDAKFFSNGHEYMLAYAKSVAALRDENTVWREEKPGARDIWEQYLSLREKHGTNNTSIESDLQKWFASLPKGNPAKKWSRYKRIDANGPWRDRDISWPGGGGPRYDVLHPTTGQACKVPERGWIYSNPEQMQRQIELGLVEFRPDHSEPPFRKAHIRPIGQELEAIEPDAEEADDEEEFATQVRGSYFYKQSQVSVRHLRTLLGKNVFNNPKDLEEIAKLVQYATSGDKQALVLDFFAGSGSTGEAVMRLNAEDGGNRQFILVQIPQPIDPKAQKEAHTFVTETLKKPDATIFEITAERLRRAGAKIEAEQAEKAKAAGLLPAQLEGFSSDTVAGSAPAAHVDTGFRVFDLVDDPDALILQKPLQQASQADVLALQAAIATPQPAQFPRILYNLLLAEGLPLTTLLRTVIDQQVYVAANVAFVVRALPLDVLTDTLRALQQDAAPPVYLTVYAPWIADDNFMLGIKTMAETLGYSEDKLRLRG
ncbi:adenine-specific DNA-methyltransferase [Polaromonas sp. CG_9.5]|uniref:site-specific DNA-methyltransferase n=1 Tax=Polaromonas sp. CG_9.5 TaxID=3071705 RepID=UPI002E0348C3|nr:adenine-specific DNA-methyltransferase [Polaromonas sp. CG_9.5]